MTHAQIAIFGGSFDPPHIGHVLLAHYALATAPIVSITVAPAFEHAFGKHLTAFEHRLAMAKLAFADLDRVCVDPIEQQLGGVSRTLRLVRELAARHPGMGMRLLIGADIVAEAHQWQYFDEVRKLAPLIVARRAGFTHPELDPQTPELPEVSSSDVRAALARGDDVRTRVPARVALYIAKHGLYRDSPEP